MRDITVSIRWLWLFQTEDGIRRGHVTGVQTCSLPISSEASGDYQNVRELFIEQLENFRDSIWGTSSPLVDASEAMVAVGLLERLRAMREPLELPWVTANTTRAA